MRGRSVRLLVSIGLATALATAAGCGNNLAVTNGAVANSADAPHLTKAEFVPALDRAMTVAGSVHMEVHESTGGKTSVAIEDASMVAGGNIRISLRDRAGVFGRPSTETHEVRLVGSRMFISAPGRKGKFFGYGTSDPRTLCGCMARHLRYDVSPAGRLAVWRQGLVGLQFIGLDAQDGLYLEHYRAQVDPVRLLGAKLSHRLKLPTRLDYEVWLDSSHLIRHLTGKVLGIEADVTYSDWGKRIDVDEPGPKDLVDPTRA